MEIIGNAENGTMKSVIYFGDVPDYHLDPGMY